MLPNLPSLVCPGCQRRIESLQCATCGTTFPRLDGLPVLFADPAHALADWRNRWRLERQRLHRDSLRAAQAAGAATGATRTRLEQLAKAGNAQREAVEAILAPLLADDRGAARETLLGLRTRLPSHHAPMSYTTHIARDWAWGEPENKLAHERIERFLGDTGGPVLVPGSGAGRLAWDLGRTHPVIALESNPLLALLSHDLARGRERRIVEFPMAPVGINDVAVHHRLKAPEGKSRLTVVLADLLNPPFAAGSFDAVVTHWLIDVIDCPFRQLVSTINHLLKPGGVWVNAGSVGFAAPDPAQNLTVDELPGVLRDGGFRLAEIEETVIPYLRSPHNRQQREEHIVTWRSVKSAETEWQPWSHLPEWLLAGDQPVPTLAAFATQAASVRIHAWLMGMIDGRRSINGIAAELTRQGLMPKPEAEAAIRNFLRVMWEEMQRSG